MADDFSSVFATLKPVFSTVARRLAVQTDTQSEYTLVTKSPSPFPQHKGQPLCFGTVRVGKAYVSLHLVPLYMSPMLKDAVSPALKKRMQGMSCFNFKSAPGPELIAELKTLINLATEQWAQKGWL